MDDLRVVNFLFQHFLFTLQKIQLEHNYQSHLEETKPSHVANHCRPSHVYGKNGVVRLSKRTLNSGSD